MVALQGRIPDRGDILRLHMKFETGSEQEKTRCALVISPLVYNRISRLVLVCPISSEQTGWPFEVPLPDSIDTYGVVLADQMRALDCGERQATFVETAPEEFVLEVMSRLSTLVT